MRAIFAKSSRFAAQSVGRRGVILKGIPQIICPDLLATLGRMGHGDEIVIADANFPAESTNERLIFSAGSSTPDLLRAILKLLPLDSFVPDPVQVMEIVGDKKADAPIFKEFSKVIAEEHGSEVPLKKLERFAFYERAAGAFAVVQTGEMRLYGNIILKKGVIGLPPK